MNDTNDVLIIRGGTPLDGELPVFRAKNSALYLIFAALLTDEPVILDGDGNHNGRYDLGDFLAWVRRANIRLSPSVMQEVQDAMAKESAEFTRKR